MANYSTLKIYEPLECFSQEEKENWEKSNEEESCFFVLPYEKDGRAYVAPENITLGVCISAILMANQIISDENLSCKLKTEWKIKKEKAEKRLSEIANKYPNSKATYALNGSWEVPLEWFALFEDKEREFYWRRPEYGGIMYETYLRRAKERLNRAMGIIKKANLGNYFYNRLKESRDFLEQYDLDSWLILSYSEVNDMFTNDELREDRSARDFWNGVSALEKGEIVESMESFGILEKRWEDVRKRGENMEGNVIKQIESKGGQVKRLFPQQNEEI